MSVFWSCYACQPPPLTAVPFIMAVNGFEVLVDAGVSDVNRQQRWHRLHTGRGISQLCVPRLGPMLFSSPYQASHGCNRPPNLTAPKKPPACSCSRVCVCVPLQPWLPATTSQPLLEGSRMMCSMASHRLSFSPPACVQGSEALCNINYGTPVGFEEFLSPL